MEIVIAVELAVIIAILAMAVRDVRKFDAPRANNPIRLSETMKKAVIKATKGNLAYEEQPKETEYVPLQWRTGTNDVQLRELAEKRFQEMQEEARTSASR